MANDQGTVSLKKPAILRFLNYNDASLKQFERSARYVFRDTASEAHLRYARFMTKDHPERSLELIERRWHGEVKGRLFKHIVCSFGDPMMSPKLGFDIMQEFALFFADYPFLFAIHTDIPRRIHAHALLGMTNLRTGKRYSQGGTELYLAKVQMNLLLQAHGLCPIRGEGLSVCPSEESNVNDETERDPPCDVASFEEAMSATSGTELVASQGPMMMSPVPTRVCDPFQRFSYATQMAYFMKGRNFHV